MTISQPYAPLSFECTGETKRFQISWPFMAARDLIVKRIPKDQDGVVLKIEADFKVDKSAILLAEAPPVGDVILVSRRTAPLQPDEITDKTTERALDRLCLIVQENIARASGDEGLSLAIHQADIDRAVEGYIKALWPELKKELETRVRETVVIHEPAPQPDPVIVQSGNDDETQEFITLASEQISALNMHVARLIKRVDDLEAQVKDISETRVYAKPEVA